MVQIDYFNFFIYF